MVFVKPEFNYQQAFKLALVAAGAFLFLTPSVGATELISARGTTQTSKVQLPTAGRNPRDIPIQLAQNTCPPNAGGGRLVHYYETTNFHVYLCQTSRGLFYTGITKSNGQGTLPLRAKAEEDGYVVKTGDITYIVTDESLSIYRGDNLLQEDRVINSR